MKDKSVVIRNLSSKDGFAWRRLWTSYLEFYETSVATEVYETTFSRLLSTKTDEFNAFIAEADGKLIGLTHYLFHRHCWKVENVCYLQDLFVSPDHRGCGAGRALINAVYEAAARSGISNVYWLTQKNNLTARKLYDNVAQVTDFIKYQKNVA